MSMASPAISALIFAATEAIRMGDADELLPSVRRALTMRDQDLHNPDHAPTLTPQMVAQGQVWAWMNRPGKGRWEIRGTGLKVRGRLALMLWSERRARALQLEAALATFLAEESASLWPEDEQLLRAAIGVARRYQQGE